MSLGAKDHAFPGSETQRGMLLRDYFAANAPEVPKWFDGANLDYSSINNGYGSRFFRWRWYYADMMLSKRDQAGDLKMP